MKKTKCAVGHCETAAIRYGMCFAHAATYIFTPEARLWGEARRAGLLDFITRQNVRHALKAEVA